MNTTTMTILINTAKALHESKVGSKIAEIVCACNANNEDAVKKLSGTQLAAAFRTAPIGDKYDRKLGYLIPDLIRSKLKEAGYKVASEQAPKSKQRRLCILTSDGVLVAMGQADTEDEAILAALLGYMRESAAAQKDWEQVQRAKTEEEIQRQSDAAVNKASGAISGKS